MTKTVHVIIVKYKNSQISAIYGLQDIFCIAGDIYAKMTPFPRGSINVEIAGEEDIPSCPPDDFCIIIIPLGLGTVPEAADHASLRAVLRKRKAEGVMIAASCAGVFILAAAGFLDGCEATTYWAYKDELVRRFPKVIISDEHFVIDHGQIVTAGGLMAWIDLGMRLVAHILGYAIMVETARYMQIGSSCCKEICPDGILLFQHDDEEVLKAQHWLTRQKVYSVTATDFAEASGLEQRTFQRRFKHAVGMSPKAYINHQIIIHALRELVNTRKSVDRIAWEAGYSDTSTFRRAFKKIMKISPLAYRRIHK